MEDGQSCHTDDNHDTLEDNELWLVTHELTPPAAGQLGNTVDASDENPSVCDNDGAHEQSEERGVEELHGFCRQNIAAAVGSDDVFDKEVGKEDENDDLEDDTCDHEIGADVSHLRARVGRSCRTTACTLESEGDNIAGNEDVGVPSWAQPGPLLTEADNDVLQREVDPGCDEGGRDDQTADLDHEAVF